MAFQIRRGTNTDRMAVAGVLASGEPYYCTDTKIMWIGDGTTTGGIEVGNAAASYANLYNVKAWGAVGSGVVDDLSAIQDAVDAAGAAGGGEVTIPDGEFAISASIVLSVDGVTISGSNNDNCAIVPLGGTQNIHAITLDNVSNCTVRGLKISGFTSSGAAEFSGIMVHGGSRNHITDNHIVGCDDSGISAGYDLYGYFALSDSDKMIPGTVDEGEYHTISNNIIENSVQGCGIELIRAEHAVVTSNIIINPATHGIRVLGAYDSVINDNVCIGGQDGVSLQGYGDAGLGVTKIVRRVVVNGNNITAQNGIDFRNGVEDAVVSDNMIVATDTYGSGFNLPYTGITTFADYDLVDVSIHNNHVAGAMIGCYVTGTAHGLKIKDNTFKDCNWAAVWVETATSGGEIHGLEVRENNFVVGSTVPTIPTIRYGMKIFGSTLYGVIGRNVYDTDGYDHGGPYQYVPYKPDANTLTTIRIDRVNVGDFGVVGDHTVDDSININYALSYIAEAGSGELWFPSGYYLCPTMGSITTADIVATGFPPVSLVGGGPRRLVGAGSPESVVTAPVGSTYLRSNGSTGTCFYVKESGTGSTGWVAK